jgi:hypothetical protein
MVALLTPRVEAIRDAGSPLAYIRCAVAAFSSVNAFGRPMDCPRARRASREGFDALDTYADLFDEDLDEVADRLNDAVLVTAHALRTAELL